MVLTKTFQELIVWQQAHSFVLMVYKNSGNFPKNELYGLASQFQRASVSIAANIAEGYKKRSRADKLRLLNISQGSLEECQYYLILSKDLNYINDEEFRRMSEKLENVSKLLNNYCRAIQSNSQSL
jgi:four helix bundle protein